MAKDVAERQKEWRARRKAEGYRMVTVWLDPDVVQILDGLIAKHERTPNSARAELINQAIRATFLAGGLPHDD
jgi:hypothetical protein